MATGFYASPNGNLRSAAEKNGGMGGRRKDINLANLDANQVEAKLKQVVEASGAKTKSLKRRPVESRTEGARGMWSQLHAKAVDV